LLVHEAHVTVQSLALLAQSHRRIHFKEIGINIMLARNADSERSLFQSVKGSAKFIDAGIALERQECIDFSQGQLPADKRLARKIEFVRILQVIIQPDQDGSPHYPFALHHRHLHLVRRAWIMISSTHELDHNLPCNPPAHGDACDSTLHGSA
jgi:hypothetical protein